MKSIFFLTVVLLSSFLIQYSFAEETVIGYDYFKTDYGNGTKTILTHEPYLFDGNNYVPYVASGTLIQTEHGTVFLNANGSFDFYKKGFVDGSPLFTDTIIAKYADVSNLESWTYPNTLNNDVPDLSWDGSELVSSKLKSSIGLLEYKFIKNNGSWKTQLEATNLSSLTTKAFGFDQIVDLNRDTIFFGGQQRNLDNFNGTTFDQTWLINNKAKVIDFLNEVSFDFDLGFDNLYSVTIYDTGANKSRLVFDYRTSQPLLPSETLVIDPTYGYTAAEDAEVLFTDQAVAGTCQTFTSNATLASNTIGTGASGDSSRCWRGIAEFNIDSVDDDLTSVTNVNLKVDLSGDTDMDSCDVYYFDDGEGSLSISQKADRASGTGSTTLLTDDSFCGTAGSDTVKDLGATADTEVLTTIQNGDSYVGIAWRGGNDPTREAIPKHINFNNLRLEITYTVSSPPTTPTNLSASGTSISNINLTWDAAPSYDNVSGYKIFRESPTGGGWSVLVNDTGSSTNSYSNAGLSTKTQYNYMIAAWNATGISNNSTASAAFTWGVPDAVTSFTVTGASETSLFLDWTAPTVYGYPVTGYKIERESPTGGGFSTIVADTGSTNTDYTDSGLSLLTEYNYRVTPISSFGNGASATASGTTPSAPPTSFTMNDCYHSCTTQLNQEWVAPSGSILGYKVLCETPVGGGFTTLINDTGSSNQYYNATGLTAGTVYNCKVAAWTSGGLSAYSNTYPYSPHKLPDIVDDLIATATSLSSIILEWTAPTPHAPAIQCYNINYTTPYGEPLTVITWCTSSTAVEYEVTGVGIGTTNSFRVSAVTVHGTNATNATIANATSFSEFTIGDLTIVTESNDLILPVLFSGSTYNSSAIQVDVRYPNTVTDFRCDLAYEYANTNQTYTNMDSEAYDDNYDVSTFILEGADNEIINFYCWDAGDPDVNGSYLKPQSTFPFVDQVDDFRSGEFGLSGEFGGFDLITLIVIIVSMVGFNKSNPAVGVIISLMVLGSTSYFGIITLPTIIFSAASLIVMLAIVVTRK